MQRVDITQDFALPVDRIFAYLSEHENLAPLFGLSVTRLQDGDTSRNGVGSVRRLRLGPLPAFEETITEVVDDQLIVYRISKGSPLKNHKGTMTFTPQGAGCRLHYVIEFDAPPVLDRIIQAGLTRNVSKGLKTVDAKA